MANVVVDIFKDAAGGLRVWPPFVFLKRGARGAGGDTLEWKNHTDKKLKVEFPPKFLELGTETKIDPAKEGKPNKPGSRKSKLHNEAQAGTYKYHVTSLDGTLYARGSESGVD